MESPSVKTLEEKGRRIIRDMFNLLIQPTKAESLLPEDWADEMREVESETQRVRVVADYISGMTDFYAQP